MSTEYSSITRNKSTSAYVCESCNPMPPEVQFQKLLTIKKSHKLGTKRFLLNLC